MADRKPPAEDLAAAVAELLDEVRTREPVNGHRRETRGRRTVTVPQLLHHKTREPGLLDQLEAVSCYPADRLQRVPVMTTETLKDKGGRVKRDEQGRKIRRSVPVRVPLTDWRGRPMMRGQWDKAAGRTVIVQATMPVTELRRSPAAGGGRSARPGAGLPGEAAGWDADGALAPMRRGTAESREPTTEALHALMEIHRWARALYRRMLMAARSRPRPRRGLDAILRHLVGLATEVDEGLAQIAACAVRSWVTAARTVIGYEAPIVHLRDICCPDCGGRLAVRADGSTPLWCTGIRRYHGPQPAGACMPLMGRCWLRYPRSQWLDLFTPGDALTGPTTDPPRRRLRSIGRIEGVGGRVPTGDTSPHLPSIRPAVPTVLAGLADDPDQEQR